MAAPVPPHFRAIVAHDLAGLREMLQDYGDPLETLPGGLTALHAAALAGYGEAVPLLVAAGMPVDAKLTAVAEQLASSAKMLESCGLDICAPDMSDWRGATPLCCACHARQLGAVIALLASGTSPSVRDAAGLTPVGNMVHTISGHELTFEERQTLQALLAAGADPLDWSDSLNGNPRLLASRSHGLTELLLRHLVQQHEKGQRQLERQQLLEVLREALSQRVPTEFHYFLRQLAGQQPACPAMSVHLLENAVYSEDEGMLAALLGSGVLQRPQIVGYPLG